MNEITKIGSQITHRILFGKTYDVPDTYYLALLKSKPLSFMGGDEINEPLEFDELNEPTGYMRLPIMNNIDSWNYNEDGYVFTAKNSVFPPALKPWGNITHWALCNAPTDGDAIYLGSLSVPFTVLEGDEVLFPAGVIRIGARIDFEES